MLASKAERQSAQRQRQASAWRAHRVWARVVVLGLALVVWPSLAGSVHANRFGPPWQSRVSVDQTLLYTQPDRSAPVVGPLERGQLVVVVGEPTSTDNTEWAQVPDGFVVSSDITEDSAPWVAEVTVPGVSIYARPNTREPVRRTAGQGDLLRVTGVAPGIEGDTAVWWSTSEGYVGLQTLREATSDWARGWSMPAADEAYNGWWGAIRSQANVRVAPTTAAPVVGTLVPGDRVKVLAEEAGQAVNGNSTWYRIDGGRYAGAVVHASLVNRLPPPGPVLAPHPQDAPTGGMLAVSRSSATLSYLDEQGQPVFSTYVSLGRAGVETPQGAYETMGKYWFDSMSSLTVADADHAYFLPNVPFVQYYRDGGYAIHAAYWHDHFGQVESQGCINLTWSDAAYLFGLTLPKIEGYEPARWAVNIPATPLAVVD